MSWTYDDTYLASSTLYQVRFEIGDTDNTAPLLSDEEINQAIHVELTMWGAAARCCEIVSRMMLRKADVRIGRGGTDLTYSTAAKQYANMAAGLRKRASSLHAPWAGGTSLAAKEADSENTDLVQPMFRKGMLDNPNVGGQNPLLADTDD